MTFRLLHLSDPHFGAADESVAARFLERANALAPDLTVLSGDLTMRARRPELEAAESFTRRLPRPFLLIPGNHDMPAFNHPLERLFNPFHRYQKSFGQLEPVFSGGKAEVISLNSSRAFGPGLDWSDGHLSPSQLRRVASFPPSDGLKMLVLHHPLLAPPGHQRAVVRPLPRLMESLAAGRVDLVLCGHFHRSLVATAGRPGVWQSVVSQAPTVCSTRLQGEAAGFHEIIRDGDHLMLTVHRYDGRDFQPESTLTFARHDDGWREA